jgi:hypothetical protein
MKKEISKFTDNRQKFTTDHAPKICIHAHIDSMSPIIGYGGFGLDSGTLDTLDVSLLSLELVHFFVVVLIDPFEYRLRNSIL